MKKLGRQAVRGFGAAAALLLLAAGAQAADIAVNSTADLPDADTQDGVCDADLVTPGLQSTLRAAVMHANVTAGADRILLPAGVYKLKLKGAMDEIGATGDLDIAEDLTLVGDDLLTTIIDGKKTKDRVFDVQPDVSFELSQVTIRGGKTVKTESGGGNRSRGDSNVHDVVIFRCKASDDGGGFDMLSGTSALTRVVINGCAAGDDGGGIDVDGGSLALDSCAVVKCKAAEGGGIDNSGRLVTMVNCTISTNAARRSGGGISLEDGGTMPLLNCTIASNRAKTGGGVSVTDEELGANTCVVQNSIFSKNKRTNADRALTSNGGNVDSGTTCGFTQSDDRSAVDPRLKVLGTYGGNTYTHPIDDASVAESLCTSNCPFADQRGTARNPLVCDSGAFEFGVLVLKR